MNGKVYVGVDVSKASLDCRVEGGQAFSVGNTPKEIVRALSRLIKENVGAELHVCFESTGIYGSALRDACWAAGLRVSVVNARRVRDWAKGCGILAKTDKIDARVICEFARERNVAPTEPPAEWVSELRGLYRLREACVNAKVLFDGNLEQTSDKRFRKRLESQIAHMEREIAKLESEMVAAVRSDVGASAMLDRMVIVKGVGELTASAVIALMPELGTLGRKRAAALAGLAPMADDSGTLTKPRHIREGRFDLRRLLYMPALCAIRYNLILRAFYKDLRKRGKPAKVALVAVMRKIMVLLDRIAGTPRFVPSAA